MMRVRRTLMALLMFALVLPALAFERPFPEAAKRGKLAITDYPQVVLDGRNRVLSAGARIWNSQNLTVIPNAIGGDTYIVNYTENLEGAIDRVWLLTEEEAAVSRNGAPSAPLFEIK